MQESIEIATVNERKCSHRVGFKMLLSTTGPV